MYKLSVRSTERLEGINIVLIDIIEKSIVNSPYDFGIPQYGGLRTAEDQKKLREIDNELSKLKENHITSLVMHLIFTHMLIKKPHGKNII